MAIRISIFEFQPRLLATLATGVGLVLFFVLGQWQLERATQKQELVDAYAQRTREAPVQIDTRSRSWQAYRYRQATVRGRYDLERQLLLDNRTYRGQAGYHVLTPLRITGSEVALLVNRGWVPVGKSRAWLPVLPGPAGTVLARGIIDLPPEQVFRLGPDAEHDASWPDVIQALETEQVAKLLGYSSLPIVLLLDVDEEDGFVRDWKPVYGIGPDKHRAYAVQWFLFALILFGIYVGVHTRRVNQA
ncbi:MAG: SURF1 family protein [Gammaproteobacteria bacterium]